MVPRGEIRPDGALGAIFPARRRVERRALAYIGEWIQSRFRIPNAEYHALARAFTHAVRRGEWVSLAQDAGMRYIVFTAKHHEGFAMFRFAREPL